MPRRRPSRVSTPGRIDKPHCRTTVYTVYIYHTTRASVCVCAHRREIEFFTEKYLSPRLSPFPVMYTHTLKRARMCGTEYILSNYYRTNNDKIYCWTNPVEGGEVTFSRLSKSTLLILCSPPVRRALRKFGTR